MARARNIKPGFYKNEDLAECSPWARLIFPGLWMLADREGRLEDRPKRIKGELLPYDSQEIEPLLKELASFKFIRRYEADGMKVIQILKFRDHQTPHFSEKPSELPPEFPESPPLEESKFPESPPLEGRAKPKKDESHPVLKRGSQPPDSLNPDSLNPDSGSSVYNSETESRARTPGNATRVGTLCKQLRSLGIDAAPHLQGWTELLPAYSDAEIIAAAEYAREKKPGERVHLNYLLPILRDRKTPTPGTATTRRSIHDERADTIAKLTGRHRGPREASGRIFDINPADADADGLG